MKVSIKLGRVLGDRKMNIQDLHDLTGIARSTLSDWYHEKTKRVDLEVLARICQAVNCDIKDLLELKEDE